MFYRIVLKDVHYGFVYVARVLNGEVVETTPDKEKALVLKHESAWRLRNRWVETAGVDKAEARLSPVEIDELS